MSFVLKEMTSEDVQKILLDLSQDVEVEKSKEYLGIAGSIKLEGKKNWAVDVSADSYLLMVGSMREQHLFRYFIYYAGCFVALELHGLNDVVVKNIPPSLQLDIDGLRASITDAFKIHGRWGDGGSGDAFDSVDAQFGGDK